MAAQDELTLLERVFLRIGSAETDEQLQNAVSKFLPPILLKLSSQQEGVRKKVMELLVHINKRIRSRPKVQLPVEALLLQYQDPAATSFVTNFTIIYIKMGYPRMDIVKQAELVPCLLHSLEGKPQSHQDSLLLMLMPVLGHIKVPTDMEKKKTLFGLSEKPKVAKLLEDFMLDMLLLPYGVIGQAGSKVSASVSVESATGGGSSGAATSGPPPGLSEYAFKCVTGENSLDAEHLELAKVGIVKFMSSGVFSEDDVVVHLIIASADTRHTVANSADMELKRMISAIDLNNGHLVSKLFSIFLGTVVVKEQKPPIKPEHKRTPASARIRMKLFNYLLKSREAATTFPSSIQVVFDCLYGSGTNPKLKLMAVQFVHHICSNCPEAKLTPIGQILLSGMVKLIAESKEDSKLRSLAYVAIGKLGQKLPNLVTKDMALVQTFFDAVCQEDQDARMAVQESLSIMCSAFSNLDPANLKVMEALLLSNIEKPEHQARLLAVQYAANVFPANHIPSRYLLLLAAGDMKEEVYAEAIKPLRTLLSNKKGESTDPIFPQFPELVTFLAEKAAQRLKSNQKYGTGNHVLAFNPSTFAEMLVYLRTSLSYNAGLGMPGLDNVQEEAPLIAKYVRQLLDAHPGDKGPIQLYIQLVRQLLTAIGGAPAMYCLLEVVAVAPEILAQQFIKNLDWIKNFMSASKEEMRENAAQLYAIVISETLDEEKFSDTLKDLTKILQGKNIESQHGATLAIGYAIARKIHRTQSQLLVKYPASVLDAVKAVVGLLGSTNNMLLGGACVTLGELGRNGSVPLQDGDRDLEFRAIYDELFKLIKSSKTNAKVREKAVLAIGYLCMSMDGVKSCKELLEKLIQAAIEIKDVEVQFTVGNALASAVLGPGCAETRDKWVVREVDYQPLSMLEPAELGWLLDEILTKYIGHGNHNIRQAACIWLLSVLNKCHSQSVMRDRLEDLQKAFINLLSENNELTQDVASRGMGLVYEYGSESQRQRLVSGLVDTLTSGRRPVQQVTDDTQVFEEGALQNPQGGKLSTYKELCSLASDLNQPDLVYKFMHLANHNAVWNSKKGAAFGFSSIASQASDQLAPFIPQIIPRLYRYQFDPNVKVQQSMAGIWHALVPEPQKTIDKYLKAIIQDLIVNLTNNQWRVRQSCCLAVADILYGRALDDVIDELPVLWETCFRVQDDIKESVRQTAEAALKTLSKVAIRMCDVNSGKGGTRVIEVLLPVLLKSGISSPVPEVREISLLTVMKLSRNAGPLLKDHLVPLLIALLESLSMLESSNLSYLSARLGDQQMTQEKIDSARVDMTKQTTMMETIKYCVQFVDGSVLEKLVPSLVDLIRSSVGLGTKVGCATFIVSLILQCRRELLPYSGKLLGVVVNGLNDRNVIVRKSYANTIGHLVKVSKDSSIEKLISKLQTWYMDKEDDAVRSACALTIQSMAHHSPDVVKMHSVQIVPLAFLAMHVPKSEDTNAPVNQIRSVWESVWLEITPGTEGGIRLHLQEIVVLLSSGLESQSWTMKAQAAAAMSTVASNLGSRLGPPHLGLLVRALLNGLPGRTWNGKENLLGAIDAISVNCKLALQNASKEDGVNHPAIIEILEAVLKECRKENMAYKKEALKCLGDILEVHQEDVFASVIEIVQPVLNMNQNRNGAMNKNDDRLDAAELDKLHALQETAFESLGKAWPNNRATQAEFQIQLCQLLTGSFSSTTWKVQIVIIKALGRFIERLYLLVAAEMSPEEENALQELLEKMVPPLCTSAGHVKYVSLRTEALQVLGSLVEKLKENGRLGCLSVNAMTEVQAAIAGVSQDLSKPELQTKAANIQKLLLAD